MSIMATCNQTRSPLGAGVKILLLLAGIAALALLAPWLVEDVNGKRHIPWRQGVAAMLVAVVLLSALLIWAMRRRAPVHAVCLVFGLLAGLCVVVDAALGLALFDYAVTRDLAVALRIMPVVYIFAAVASVLGCVLGFVGAMGVSFLQRRATRGVQADASEPSAATRRSWLPRLVGWSLLAALAVALYFPVAHELRRRHAVLTLRSRGAEVQMMGPRFPGGMPQGSIWETLVWLQRGGLEWQREGVLYSLESPWGIRLSARANDSDMVLVSRLPEVQSLGVTETQLTDAGWEQLQLLPAVRFLDVSGSSISDHHLRHLAGATSLRYLNLSHTQISDDGLQHLSGLWLLAQLDLRHTAITDAGLEHLGGMISLRDLQIGNTQVHGAGLRHLRPLLGLNFLDLSGTELTESGLARLNALSQLAILSFQNAQFNATAFKDLRQLPQVRDLHLQGTNVADAWLPHLAAMKNPRLNVHLARTQVTPEGVRALQSLLPQAKVFGGQPVAKNPSP